MKKILFVLLIGIVLSSCDSFLDEEPAKSDAKKIETVDDLDKLFNGMHYSLFSTPNFYCTDNFEIPIEVYNESPSVFSFNIIEQYLFATKIDKTPDQLWDRIYYSIWTCNSAINLLNGNSITGSEELKKQLLAEAHFLRATLYFELALDYCLHPTNENGDELGLPIRIKTDYEESLVRASLADTYKFIEDDLLKALSVNVSRDRIWRFSTAAVEAFCARFYLYKGSYEKASEYAAKALGKHSEMIDYDATFSTVTDSKGIAYPMTNNYMTYQSTWMNFWKGQYIHRSYSNDDWKTLPSRELLNLYDTKDKRYEMFMVENYLKRFGLQTHPYVGYIQGGNFGEYVSGPSTSEMYLILAETKARAGDITGAMQEVEKVRVKRFASSDYRILPVPSDKKSGIQAVIDERRREMPFTIRWYDIRRLNVDPDTDNITVRRRFYSVEGTTVNGDGALKDYIIAPNSRLYARPLNDQVINLSDGETVQNTY